MKNILRYMYATGVVAATTPLLADAAGVAPVLDTNPVGALPVDSGVYESTELLTVISTVINFLLGFVGAVIFLLFLYAGFQYATAAGDEAKTEQATKTMVQAVIGLIIVFVAFTASNTILAFVFQTA
jgi:hypothetical protein